MLSIDFSSNLVWTTPQTMFIQNFFINVAFVSLFSVPRFGIICVQ